MTTIRAKSVEHSNVASFADSKVNLKREDVKAFRDQVNRLRDRLADYIAEHPDYDLVKMLHSGSVMKGTALKTVNDMDVAVYIRPSEHTAGERRLLPWLRDRLQEVYPTMRPEQLTIQHHCVTVSFAGSGLDVDVVPVIADSNGYGDGYLIVKDTGERVRTSIAKHLEFIRLRKATQPGHFSQVVRLLKWWARQRKLEDDAFRLKSFLVELVCAKLADDGLDCSDYSIALERIFAYIVSSALKTRIAFTDNYNASALPAKSSAPIEIFDPVNPANNVAARYTEAERSKIVDAAADALDALTEARYATTQGRSVAMWQVVFGPSFRVES